MGVICTVMRRKQGMDRLSVFLPGRKNSGEWVSDVSADADLTKQGVSEYCYKGEYLQNDDELQYAYNTSIVQYHISTLSPLILPHSTPKHTRSTSPSHNTSLHITSHSTIYHNPQTSMQKHYHCPNHIIMPKRYLCQQTRATQTPSPQSQAKR